MLFRSNDARQGNVETQGSTLQNQLELYAAQNSGTYPTIVQLNANAADGSANGWSVMIDGNYIKEAPVNPFGGSTVVAALVAVNGTAADTEPNASAATGWLYNATTGVIRAAGANY